MKNKQLKGKLEFISFNHVKLFKDNKEIDLGKYLDKLFSNLNGKNSSMNYTMNSIEIKEDNKSEYILEYKKLDHGIFCLLKFKGKFGFFNVESYLSEMLQRLNGRNIIANIDKNKISFEPDLDYKVFEVYYTDCNSCRIEYDKVQEICKPGSSECCIFLSVSGNGFECEKFDSHMARILLDRHSKGTMNAKRIGNCTITGRKEKL